MARTEVGTQTAALESLPFLVSSGPTTVPLQHKRIAGKRGRMEVASQTSDFSLASHSCIVRAVVQTRLLRGAQRACELLRREHEEREKLNDGVYRLRNDLAFRLYMMVGRGKINIPNFQVGYLSES